MILIGRDLSPFVRVSATVLNLCGIEYERRLAATDEDADFIRSHNPLGRVPALLLNDAETIIDSVAIVDHALMSTLDDDHNHSLLATNGAERRQTQYIVAIARGTMEKAVASAYEIRMRPKEYVYTPYRERLLAQVSAGLGELEAQLTANWFGGDSINLADAHAVVAYDFVTIVAAELTVERALPKLSALSARANATPEFATTRWQADAAS